MNILKEYEMDSLFANPLMEHLSKKADRLLLATGPTSERRREEFFITQCILKEQRDDTIL